MESETDFALDHTYVMVWLGFGGRKNKEKNKVF